MSTNLHLHPAVQHILHSGQYDHRPDVEIFTEHELKKKNGKVIKVTKATLEEIAKVNNRKTELGALTPIGPGHTFDDEYDKEGRLVRKFPEDQQPKPFGYYYKYSVALNPATGKHSLYVNEYVQKRIVDPQTGKEVDGLEYTASFPRRSAEIYHSESWIDWVAALRRAPRLDMGAAIYEKADPDHCLYARAGNQWLAVGVEMGKPSSLKTRYAVDTAGESAMDPTADPSAEGPPVEQAAADDPNQLPPEHMEAAERYAAHTFGMHHSRLKAMTHHWHNKYGHECGMSGDPMTPHTPGPAAPAGAPVAPAAVDPKLAALGGTSAMPEPGNKEPDKKAPPEHSKMSKTLQDDQDAIEKARYAKELSDLRDEVAELRKDRDSAKQESLDSHMDRHLLQMVHEGFPINAQYQKEFCAKHKYGREQFDEYVGHLRETLKGHQAPIEEVGPLGETRDFQSPRGGDAGVREEDFNRYQRAIRQGMSEEDAREKYMKESRNGVAAK